MRAAAAGLFLVFLVVLWDVTIRVFNIPPYQIPSPSTS